MAISNPSNVKKRSDKTSPLTQAEVDGNFQEVRNVINDATQLENDYDQYVNDNDQRVSNIEDGVYGVLEVPLSGSDITLSGTQLNYTEFKLTGTLTADVAVIVPTDERTYTVVNETTGDYSVTVRTSAGSGVAVPKGQTFVVRCDGVDVIRGVDSQRTIYAGSVAELEALSLTNGQQTHLSAGGRTGTFRFNSSDLSDEVASDPLQGVYIAPSSDPTGTSGASVRQYGQNVILNTPVITEWFGAVNDWDGSTGTDNKPAFQAAADFSFDVKCATSGPYFFAGTVELKDNRVYSDTGDTELVADTVLPAVGGLHQIQIFANKALANYISIEGFTLNGNLPSGNVIAVSDKKDTAPILGFNGVTSVNLKNIRIINSRQNYYMGTESVRISQSNAELINCDFVKVDNWTQGAGSTVEGLTIYKCGEVKIKNFTGRSSNWSTLNVMYCDYLKATDVDIYQEFEGSRMNILNRITELYRIRLTSSPGAMGNGIGAWNEGGAEPFNGERFYINGIYLENLGGGGVQRLYEESEGVLDSFVIENIVSKNVPSSSVYATKAKEVSIRNINCIGDCFTYLNFKADGIESVSISGARGKTNRIIESVAPEAPTVQTIKSFIIEDFDVKARIFCRILDNIYEDFDIRGVKYSYSGEGALFGAGIKGLRRLNIDGFFLKDQAGEDIRFDGLVEGAAGTEDFSLTCRGVTGYWQTPSDKRVNPIRFENVNGNANISTTTLYGSGSYASSDNLIRVLGTPANILVNGSLPNASVLF